MPIRGSKRPKKRYILPFATLGENRFRDFTKNMEMAAILYLAESNRKKGESPPLKRTEEKLVFIAQVCYPIWLVPYNTTTLIFDGLGLASHTISNEVTPEIEIFNNDIRRNQETTETCTATLARNIDYFRNIQGKEETKIEGLITTHDLKEDLRNYLPLMKEVKKPFTTQVVLSPIVKAHEIQIGIKQLSTLRKKNEKDIQNLEAGMTLLAKTTARRVKTIREEIKKSRETHHKRIKKTKLKSTTRLRQIQSQYNRKIARTSKKFKRRLLRLNKDQAKKRGALRGYRKDAKRFETKLRSKQSNNRKQNKFQLTMNLERVKKKITNLNKEIEKNAKRIRIIEKAQRLELAKQRIQCCKRIELANRIFLDLKGSLEAEIIMKSQEIEALEDVTRYITKSMQDMAQKKKMFRLELDSIAIPQGKWPRRLVYIPFYLVRYEKGDKKRYVTYPPAIIEDMGVLTKMKGALGAAKVKALVKSRSEATAKFTDQLLSLFENKPLLEKDVTEAGIQKSILLRKHLRLGVTKGLEELENQNWISKNEHRTFSQILYIYTPSANRQINAMLISENNLKCLSP